jgi:hypothetical protein
MYKNVLNQCIIGIIALCIAGFPDHPARAEAKSPSYFINSNHSSIKNPCLSDSTQSSVKSNPQLKATETTINAKADPVDTAWHPQRRLWGFAFGDFYYDQHSPLVTSTLGKENNYYQGPSGRNAFQFRRIYLGYDYEITKKFKAEVLLASEPSENTLPTSATSSVVNGDNLADGKMAFYIKNFNLRVRDVWTGTDFVIGELSTPGFALNEPGTNGPTSLSEATWSYRSIERTVTDFHRNNAYDIGAALQGTFDPATKNFGYVVMVGDNTIANVTTIYNPNAGLSTTNPNPNTGFFKIFYGDLWGKFFNQHLYLDLYADYAKTASNTASAAVAGGTVGPQEHNMFKIFAAYNTKPITVGVEAYTQNIDNAVLNSTTKSAEQATVNAISLWIRGSIVKNKWSYFARFDTYNPDTKFNSADTYSTVYTNYGPFDPTVKEQFYTAGLDYTPAKNIHFMPNVWLTRYIDQYNSNVTAHIPDNHTLVYRMTFFYVFGK